MHDYIKEYGGAERVLEALHELYPDAPVYTTVYLPQFLGPHKERFKSWIIKTSWLQKIPMKGKLISPFRILSPFVFRSFNFSKYDVIIVSATGAYFPNSLGKKKAIQICYCHTPPRYLYGYATAREWKKNIVFRIFAAIANHFLRMVDYDGSKNVDYYIANSEEVASRISKFYRREAVVIYPPVDTKILSNKDIKKKSPNILISQY
ncbi:MAG: glycosyltransferase, partial [Candidatus Levybacteria bacterium]|nr:glycosyltransferase [Candidatus Levybacteria bacterium]